jgi:hypothetical protein
MTTKGNHDTVNWLKNITTWALLGIAGYQFSSLTTKVDKVHDLVIKHDARIDNHKEEIDRLRRASELNRTQLSAKQ